jgi:hypothetical protein
LNALTDGVDAMLLGGYASEEFDSGTAYTLTVQSEQPGRFDFSIMKAGKTTAMNKIRVAVDSKKRFTGGYAGLYSVSSSIFDNFRFGPNGEQPAVIHSDPGERLLQQVDLNQRRIISDEDFFGVYAGGEWKKNPMIDYAYSQKLEPVKAAAVRGDYKQAAEKLLAYYRTRDFKRQTIPESWSEEKNALVMDNIIGFDQQEKLVAVFPVSTTPRTHKLNVTGTVRAGKVTFMLMGRNKNQLVSFISSRESSKAPVLELMIDGKWISVKPDADLFIRAGEYARKNFGTQNEMEVCNSGSVTGKPFDGDTRRALIQFDLSRIDVGQVSQAQLKLNAWSESDGNRLILWRSYPTVIDEKTQTWENTIGYQYSWENLPGGIEWGRPNGAHSQYPNWVSRLPGLVSPVTKAIRTGDEVTARKIIDLLLDFADEYRYQSLANGELNAGLGRIPFFSQYLPYLFDSKAMTPKDCVEMLKFICKECEHLRLNPSKLRRDNYDNMGLSLIAAMTTVSVTFPELADAGIWKKDAFVRADDLMNHLIQPDGSYTEHTMGYPFYVLGAMLDLIEFCAERDAGLPDSFAGKTHQLARYMMNMSFPDGVPPRWGEGGPGNTKIDPNMRRAAVFFNDPQLKWWCGVEASSAVPPDYTSVHYPDSKIVMFRSGWDNDIIDLFISSRVGGGHYHVDQNHLSLYAYGSRLLPDTGMSSYSWSHPHFDWQRHQTRSHNTVEVDETGFPRLESRSKPITEGPCGTTFADSDPVAYYEGWADGYPDVRHVRRLLYIKDPGFFIVYDLMQPKDTAVHTYDQNWHLYPTFPMEANEKLMRIQSKNTATANITVQLVYPAPAETGLLVRDGFSADPLMDTKYAAFRQKKAGPAEFCTVLWPSRKGVSPDVTCRTIMSSAGAVVFAIESEKFSGIYMMSRDGSKKSFDVGSNRIEITAQAACLATGASGPVQSAVLIGGSQISVNGTPLPLQGGADDVIKTYKQDEGFTAPVKGSEANAKK